MLEFINNNGVLFSGIFSIIVALISVLVAVLRDNKNSKIDTIKSLRKELEEARSHICNLNNELTSLKSLEDREKNIDKSHESIYYEKLSQGGSRAICGFCWEKEHVTIPIVPELSTDEYTKQQYLYAKCNVCKSSCIENLDTEIEPSIGELNNDLLF